MLLKGKKRREKVRLRLNLSSSLIEKCVSQIFSSCASSCCSNVSFVRDSAIRTCRSGDVGDSVSYWKEKKPVGGPSFLCG